MNKRNSRLVGFTLIELLIVISMIAIFVGGAFEMFGRSLRTGRLLEADADLAEQLTLAEYALVRDCVPGRPLAVDDAGRITIAAQAADAADGSAATEAVVWEARDGQLVRTADGVEQALLRDLSSWSSTREGALVRIEVEVAQPFGTGRRARAASWCFAAGKTATSDAEGEESR